MLFVAPIGIEILPQREKLVAVLHPGYYNKPSFLYPYERNKKSTAYIPPLKKEYHYYMGSLNGGVTEEYMKLVEECSKNTHIDYEANYIAMVHDESHLNKYLSEHKCLSLSPAFAYPEGKKFSFLPKIVIRDKVKLDPYFNKGRNHSLLGKIEKGWLMLVRAIKWYL